MNTLYRFLLKTSLFQKLMRNPVPRWTILFLDVAIVISSCLLLIAADIYKYDISSPNVRLKMLAIVIIYTMMDILTHNYQCIIRLSVLEDTYRISLTVFGASATLFALNLIKNALTTNPFYFYWEIIFIGFIVFSLLLASRIVIKYFFLKISNTGVKRTPIIVLGSALNSIVLASALKNENQGKFEPMALLSLSTTHNQSNINGIPVEIYNPDNVADIFKKYDCSTLVFLATQKPRIQNGIAEVLLKNDITLLLLNQIEEFDISEDGSQVNASVSSHIKNIQIEDLLGREPISYDNTMVKSHIKNHCVMITGAAGSIGSEIVRQVAKFHASEIILVDQAETPMHNMQLEMEEKFPNTIIKLFIGDVKDKVRMEEAFKEFQPYFVFHAAAYKHVPMMEMNPSEAVLTNIMGTRNVADLALKYNVHKFVMISTDKAVNPANIMGATKRIAEIYVQSLYFNELSKRNGSITQFITTRFGNVLGSNGSVIPLFRKQIEKGGPVTVTHRDIIRYFMTIPEACSLVLEAGCMGNGGEIYIFDMGKPIKIYNLACKMITLAGLKVGTDIKIKETGLRPGEKLYEELLNDKEKTTATVNEKIMIAQVRKYDYADVCNNIVPMISAAHVGDIHKVVWKMKCLVPEFKSMNSEFEKIDKEMATHNVVEHSVV